MPYGIRLLEIELESSKREIGLGLEQFRV